MQDPVCQAPGLVSVLATEVYILLPYMPVTFDWATLIARHVLYYTHLLDWRALQRQGLSIAHLLSPLIRSVPGREWTLHE